MRIALIGPTHPARGGISHYNTLLARQLSKDHEVFLFAFRRQYPGFLFPGKSQIDTQSALRLDFPEALQTLDTLLPWTWIRTAAKIRSLHAELVVLHWWTVYWAPFYLVLLPLIGRHTRIVFICHNIGDHEPKPFEQIAVKRVLRLANLLIVHSENARKKVQDLLPTAQVITVPHPCYGVFNQGQWTRQSARQKLRLSGNVLLFFGFVRPYKGLKPLLAALRQARRLALEVTLVVAGEFWRDKENILGLIESLGLKNCVRIEDRYIANEEVELFFKAADAVVLPYLSGSGSGIAALAAGFGKPVFASDSCGLDPALPENRKNVIRINPLDAADFAGKIIRFFNENNSDHTEQRSGGKNEKSWEILSEMLVKGA
jgi:glycosyltransferase involved in cell wall biosynthesis